jgi:hypothetical protein
MKHAVIGNSMSVTDSVKRAMEHLKDRPMPQPKAENRRNTQFGKQRPPEKPQPA